MPNFAFLFERELDTSLTQRKLRVLRRMGHPYSDAEIENAVADARRQAESVVASLRKDHVELSERQARSEVIALIAYLQSLGRVVKDGPVKLAGDG